MQYLGRYEKDLVCDPACPGAMNCNMFGVCPGCRGCFMTCKGAVKYVDETSAIDDAVTFCSDGEVSHVSECYVVSDNQSGFGSGSGSGSMGGAGSGNGSASGSGSSGVSWASGSGSGNGTSSMVAGGSGSASGGGSMTIGGGKGSASGSGSRGVGGGTSFSSSEGSVRPSSAEGSASGEGSMAGDSTGKGSASGHGSFGSGRGSGSATGSGHRGGGDVPGCSCDEAMLDPAEAAFFCDNNKSFYCDAECLPDSDPLDRLFYDMGGLWCQPFGWEGCRLCHLDCEDFGDKYCVPCPAGVQGWCV